ncbi:MAG: peptide/nickel transport system substrate-binding protein [Candidatus Binataceae bacterium]|jgi:peptide/nickel transport system substrate-binding protein|nr:peptide/nickel transport system substrate-binding protein [Candidatus Binataceae bacterium]MEA2678430.1 peptide/nickel transport system substrate-binding protein [Candidatus Binataceae bacterium]
MREVRASARIRAIAMARAASACLLMIAACAKPVPLMPPGYLQIDIPTAPSAIDPRFAADAISARVAELIYDSLVRMDRDGNFSGNLADRFEHSSPDEIVFHLRRNVRFSDGRPFTARDVKFTYDSILNPGALSIKRAVLTQMDSLTVADDYTVVMRTRRPYAPALTMATLGIVPAGSPISGKDTTAEPPPGTGPLRLVAFARDQAVMLARNSYHPHPANALAGLLLKVVPDPTVRVLELTEGICGFAQNDALQSELIPYLTAQPRLRIVRAPGNTYHYLVFNFRDTRLRDVRVRQAIAYAIDREAIVASMVRGNARVATGLLAPENWAYTGGVTRYPFDPGKARTLLEAAGYSSSSHPLRMIYNTTPEGRRLGEALQSMLAPVGVLLDIHTNEWATFYGDLRNGNFDIASSQWVGVGDPHQYYEVFDSHMTPPAGGSNRGYYSNPRMDRLLEAGDSILEPAARRAIYAHVQQLAADDLPYVSLWWDDNVVAMDRRLAGFEPYPNGSLISLATAAFRPANRAPRIAR